MTVEVRDVVVVVVIVVEAEDVAVTVADVVSVVLVEEVTVVVAEVDVTIVAAGTRVVSDAVLFSGIRYAKETNVARITDTNPNI